MGIIRFLLISVLMSMWITSACTPATSSPNNPPGIQTVFSGKEVPDGTKRIFSEIDWSSGDKLTIQEWQIEHYPSFIGDITTGNTLPFYLDNSIADGSLPLISKDGRYIAFQSEGKLYIASMEKVASNNYSITSDSYVDVLDKKYRCSHAWAPESRQLASICLTPNDGISISFYDLAQRSVQEVFEYSEEYIGEVERVSWSSDGKVLAFSLRYRYDDKPAQSDIFIYRVDVGSLVRITNTTGDDEQDPDWYPGSRIFTFTSTKEGDAESIDSRLAFSTEDGKCIRLLPNLKGFVHPSWSPDGSQLAYISDWMDIKVLETSQFVPSDFLSPQGLCASGAGEP